MGRNKPWTVMVYIAGDNDLEGMGYGDIQEMMQVGSSRKLNVLVQFDNRKKGTLRYHVRKGSVRRVAQLPETNAGDPANLTKFVQWAMASYPADHYLLGVWNHGSGWEDVPFDFDWDSIRSIRGGKRLEKALFSTTVKTIAELPEEIRAIALDADAKDFLDNQELKEALVKALPGGRKLDIIGFDACLMNMLEVAYQVRDVAHYLVGSQELEPGEGWPYDQVLGLLAAQPDIAPRDLAKGIVRVYGESYKGQEGITQSAFDMARIEELAVVVTKLAEALMASLPGDLRKIDFANANAQRFYNPDYLDLIDLAAWLSQEVGTPAVKEAAEAIYNVARPKDKEGFVLANTRAGQTVAAAYGVSIYLPRWNIGPRYEELDFSKKAKWYPYLLAYAKARADYREHCVPRPVAPIG